MDRLGYVSSDRGNARIKIEDHVKSVKAVVKQYNKASKIILVGHSYRGYDTLAPFEENMNFSKKNIPLKYLDMVIDQDGDQLCIWNRYEMIKNYQMIGISG